MYCSCCGAPVDNENQTLAMPSGFTFIDVETPNRHNDRICAIGVIRTDEKGKVLAKEYTLVNPAVRFDPFNIGIHGIDESDVKNSPLFPEAWERLQPLFEDAVPVAHNARFDLSVIDKSLAAHGIAHGPVSYACTLDMARSQIPMLGRYRLNEVCNALGVALDNHHNAMADAWACMEIFYSLNQPSELKEYVPIKDRGRESRKSEKGSKRSNMHSQLIKRCEEILRDGRVTFDEAVGLRWWLEDEANAVNDSIVENLLTMLSSVLEDGEMSHEEEKHVIGALEHIVNPVTHAKGIDIAGKRFCLTGDFKYGPRDTVISYLESLGGVNSKNVTKNCDLVIVGNLGSFAYAHGSYGSKVKKAMEYQEKGVKIEIVLEKDLGCFNIT